MVLPNSLTLSCKPFIYICSPVLRHLFKLLEAAALEVLGLTAPLSHFKKKYHGHDYGSLRLFHTDSQRPPAPVPKLVKTHIPDYLIVAIHLAKSWGSSDQYVEDNICYQLINHVRFTCNNNTRKIVDDFINSTFVACDNAEISEGEAWFSFREYLSSKNLPLLVFNEEFHKIMKAKLQHENKCYKGYTCNFLPVIRAFSGFWRTQMVPDSKAYPIEIDDVVMLFRRHTGAKRLRNSNPLFFKSL